MVANPDPHRPLRSVPNKKSHHHHEEHKHAAPLPPTAKVQRTLHRLVQLVTADLLVNTGVLGTGVVLVTIELGLVPHDVFAKHDEPTKVVVVRREPPAGGHH